MITSRVCSLILHVYFSIFVFIFYLLTDFSIVYLTCVHDKYIWKSFQLSHCGFVYLHQRNIRFNMGVNTFSYLHTISQIIFSFCPPGLQYFQKLFYFLKAATSWKWIGCVIMMFSWILLCWTKLGSLLASVHKKPTLHILDLLAHLRTICARFLCEYD